MESETGERRNGFRAVDGLQIRFAESVSAPAGVPLTVLPAEQEADAHRRLERVGQRGRLVLDFTD